tara:strand:+ start:1037 stop:1651 length:615 start_codon:yes stop_codon:yes gene_type:complete
MAVPSSGAISLLGIYNELHENNYSSGTSRSNISLEEESTEDTVDFNTANDAADYPDTDRPHAMSEFYNYDHDKASASWGTIFSNISDQAEPNDTWESSQVSAKLTAGVASNVDITSDNSTHHVKYRLTASGTWSSYQSSHLNIDWSSYDPDDLENNGVLYLMFKRDMPVKAEGAAVTTTFTVTDDSASNDAAFSRTVTTQCVDP